MIKKTPIALLAALALSACVNPTDFETAPVQVETAKGTVTCQLYTKENVIWDRALSVPNGMSIAEGDSICKQEGLRQKSSQGFPRA